MWRDPAAMINEPEARRSVLSPALQTFAANPFHVLRIALRITTEQAAFAAERAMTMARAGLPAEGPDLLPWLDTVEPTELQRAAQTIEEPLARLKHEFLWFDVAADPWRAELAAALATHDEATVVDYLTHGSTIKPPAAVLIPANDTGVATGDTATAEAPTAIDDASIACAINMANLHLLIAACQLNGRWPTQLDAVTPAAFTEGWQVGDGSAVLMQPHRGVSDARLPEAAAIQQRWARGIATWVRWLDSAAMTDFVVARIAAIDDDFVHPDDAPAVIASLRAHLVDVSAQEIRALVLRNQYGLAGAIIAALHDSGLEPRELTPAMRPVRQIMQGELTALASMLEQCAADDLGPVEQYLRRLAIIRTRWLALDENNVLGLVDLLDSAAEKAFLKLKQWGKPTAATAALLDQIGTIAAAQSLRERVETLRKRHDEEREHVCYYCQENDPVLERSVILKGKKETHRTRSGGQTTVHSVVTWRPIWRCDRCATWHSFVTQLTYATMGVLTIALLAFTAVLLQMPDTPNRSSFVDNTTAADADPGMINSADTMTMDPDNAIMDSTTDSMTSNASAPAGPIAEPAALTKMLQQITGGMADFAVSQPVAGGERIGADELRYCRTADDAIDSMVSKLHTLSKSNENVENYNHIVRYINELSGGYNSVCTNKSYRASIGDMVGSELLARKAEIANKASELIR